MIYSQYKEVQFAKLILVREKLKNNHKSNNLNKLLRNNYVVFYVFRFKEKFFYAQLQYSLILSKNNFITFNLFPHSE